MKKFYTMPWVICFLLFQNITLHSQTSMTGKITDKVTGEEMIAANIIVSKAGVFVAGETSDIDGNYSIRIDPGTYDLKVTYTGYVGHLMKGVIAKVGQATKVDLQISTSKAELGDIVTLEYKVPLTPETLIEGTVTSEQIRNLPIRNINIAAAGSFNSIMGKVTDAMNGEGLIGVKIIISKAGVLVAGGTTDFNGYFKIGVDPGTYDIHVSYIGYEEQVLKKVKVNKNQVVKINPQLKIGEVLDEVVVNGYKIPFVIKDETSTGGTVTSEHLKSLPGRDISTLATTVVGVSSSDRSDAVILKGSASTTRDYYIDGVRVEGKKMVKDSKVSIIETKVEEELLIEDSRILITDNKFFESTDYVLRDKIEIKNNFAMVELDPAKVIILKKNTLTPPKVKTPKAGQLTAAEWRDADYWKVWTTQQKDKDYKRAKGDWKFYLTNRYAVLVKNKKGQPLADVQVELVNAKKNILWTSRTDNEGKADLWAGIFDRREGTNNLKIIASYNGKKHTIRKAKPYKKINNIRIKTDCNLSNKVDIMFAVDATGSMGDEINFLKSELQNVIERVQKSDDELDIRLGSVFYRDVSDSYLTQSIPLDSDISKTVNFINNQRAGGGGDFPEAVDAALEETIQKQNWSKDAVARIVFLVLDAPPHMQKHNIESLQKSIRMAAEKGIKIIPVTASGINRSTEYLMKTMALATSGTYVFITDDSGIGNSHLNPKNKDYKVEKLNDLLMRLIGQYTDRESCEEEEEENEELNNEVLFANNHANTNSNSIVVKEDKSILNNVKYFPNPASTGITLQLQESISEIMIIQPDGKVVKRFEDAPAGEMRVDSSGLSEGFYLIRFRKENGVANGKLIVVKP